MSFFDYLRQNVKDWHENVNKVTQSISRNRRSLAGDTGEEFVKRLLGHRNFSKGGGGLMLSNKRVPMHETGKREIDFIIISQKKIHVIEVKNWSGRIQGKLDDYSWIKESNFTENKEDAKQYRNLVFDNLEKSKVLLSFLNRIGFDVGNKQIEHKVFFVDTVRGDGSVRLHMDKSIEESPNVITTPKLGYYLNIEQANNVESAAHFTRLAIELTDRLLTYVLGEEVSGRITDGLLGRVGKEKHKRMLEDVKYLPTWDHVKLFGGEVVRGDIMGHYGYHGIDWQKMFIDHSGIDISKVGRINNNISERNCKDLTSKSASLVRSMLMGNMPLILHQSLKEILFGLHERLEKIPTNIARGNVDYNLRFKPAASPTEINLELPGITEIQYGNRQTYLHWLFNNVIPRNKR